MYGIQDALPTQKSNEFTQNIEQQVSTLEKQLRLTNEETLNWNAYVRYVEEKTGKKLDGTLFAREEVIPRKRKSKNPNDNKIIRPNVLDYIKESQLI